LYQNLAQASRKEILMCMRRIYLFCLSLAVCLPFASGQQATIEKHEPALDVTSMDRSIDPCVDFFAYSCGGWIKNNPIPPDQSSWDTYSKMEDENRVRLRGILEAAAAPDAGLLYPFPAAVVGAREAVPLRCLPRTEWRRRQSRRPGPSFSLVLGA